MRKILLLSLTVLATVLAFISCEREKTIAHDDVNVEVMFTSNIVSVNPATKMGGNTWAINDLIGIYMFEDASTTVVEGIENITYKATTASNPGSFVPQTTTIYFPDNGSDVRFMSYYPYTAAIVSNIYEVDVSNQSNLSNIDLLYSFKTDAKYNKKTVDKKVPLVFEHKLSNIIVNVKAGEGLLNSDLEDIEISFAGLNTKADFNLLSGLLLNPTDRKSTRLNSSH